MSKPAIFSDLSLHEARLQANAASKLLLIDVGATWCAPCQHMDKTTWLDPSVIQWVANNAIAVQFDADAHRHVVETLSIRAFPTMILERESRELDRSVGGRNAAALIDWLQCAQAGRTQLEVLFERSDLNNRERLTRAKLLERANRDDEALNDLIWLWEHALDNEPEWPDFSSVLTTLKILIKRDTAARVRVRQLRDEVGERRTDQNGFGRWVTLSALLEETDGLVNWLTEIDPTLVEQLEIHLNRSVFRILIERNQLALLGRLLRDACALLETEFQELRQAMVDPHPGYPPEIAEDTRVYVMNWQRQRTQNMRRALLAAGRTGEAKALVETALRLDNTDAMKRALES